MQHPRGSLTAWHRSRDAQLCPSTVPAKLAALYAQVLELEVMFESDELAALKGEGKASRRRIAGGSSSTRWTSVLRHHAHL